MDYQKIKTLGALKIANYKQKSIKDELTNATKDAHDNEIFGAPSFVVNNKLFWGQDRLKFALEEYKK